MDWHTYRAYSYILNREVVWLKEGNELYAQIPSMSLKEAYKLYMAITRSIEDDEEISKETEIIKKGDKVRIDIFNIIREDEGEESAIFVDYEKEYVKFRGKIFELIKYDEEKDTREAIIKARLEAELREESARGMKVQSSLQD